jgi:hypothetical protein
MARHMQTRRTRTIANDEADATSPTTRILAGRDDGRLGVSE